MRGTKATLTITQGAEQRYKPALYVDAMHSVPQRASMRRHCELPSQSRRPRGRASTSKRDGDAFVVTVPDKYHDGHEAHFAQVTENFLELPARRKASGLGSAEHADQVRHDHAGLRAEPIDEQLPRRCTATALENRRSLRRGADCNLFRQIRWRISCMNLAGSRQ